jgi:CRP/FNR family cyclic AMP-dependent transcriptional regulator
MDLSSETFQRLPVQNVAAGDTVLEQGTSTGRLFILIEGKVDILKDGKPVATSSQPGDIFGDLSALLDVPHTTAVKAVTDSKFYVATDARLFLAENPTVCMHLCELLARRLVSVTDYLVAVKEQFAGHDHIGMVDEFLDKLIHRHPRKRIAPRSSTVNIPEIAD